MREQHMSFWLILSLYRRGRVGLFPCRDRSAVLFGKGHDVPGRGSTKTLSTRANPTTFRRVHVNNESGGSLPPKVINKCRATYGGGTHGGTTRPNDSIRNSRASHSSRSLAEECSVFYASIIWMFYSENDARDPLPSRAISNYCNAL